MEEVKKYFAFISYNRKDEKWAKWLHRTLEHYRLPAEFRRKDSLLPKEIRPVFLDSMDLSGGVLTNEIEDAIKQSRFLIVICSTSSIKSDWVNEEIRKFIDSGRVSSIIPFIIDGVPKSGGATECFPEALLNLSMDQEILGINKNEIGKDRAAIKIIAQMLNVKFDTLWQRHEREKRRRKLIRYTVVSAIIAISVAVSAFIWKAYWRAAESQSRFVAEKAMPLALEDSYLVQRLACEILPKNLRFPNRPYVPEAEALLRKACYGNQFFLNCESPISCCRINADQTTIVTGTEDGDIQFWDVQSGALLKKIHLKESFARCISFGNPTSIAVALDMGKVVLLNINTGDIVWSQSITLIPEYIDYYSDKQLITCISGIHTAYSFIEILDTSDKANVKEIDMGVKGISYPGFNSDYTKLVFVTDDGVIHLWDLTSMTEELIYSSSRFGYICFGDSDNCFITWNYDDYYSEWRVEGNKFIFQSNKTYQNPQKVTLQKDYNCLKVKFENSLEPKLVIGKINFLPSFFSPYLSFTPKGDFLVSAHRDTVKVCNLTPPYNQHNYIGDGMIRGFTVSPDEETIIAYTLNHSLYAWNLRSGELLNKTTFKELIESAAISPDGRTFAVLSGDYYTRIWDLNEWKEKKILSDDDGELLSFSQDGRWLISRSWNSITIRNVTTGAVIKGLHLPYTEVSSLTFSPDHKWLAFIHDSSIHVWDFSGWKEHISIPLERLTSQSSISISPDGSKIAVAEHHTVESPIKRLGKWSNPVYTGRFRIIDANSRNELFSHADNGKGFCAIAFSPDGQSIAISDTGGDIYLWPFPDLQELIDKTRDRFRDNPLTREERRRYHID